MISKNVMLDPSLFIDRQVGSPMEARNAIDELGQKTNEILFLDFYIPETFEAVVFDDEKEAAWNSVKEFFGTSGDFPDRDILQYKLQHHVRYNTFSITTPRDDSEEQLRVDIHEMNEGRYSDERNRILAELNLDSTSSDTISQILIEELAFGLEMSPIVSRLKKPFQKMSAAAQSVTTLSERDASSTATYIIDWLENELPRFRQGLNPLEALEVAIKYKKMDVERASYKLALYREALKDEIPLTNWIAAPTGFYLPYAYAQFGALSGDPFSDMSALISGGFALTLLDP